MAYGLKPVKRVDGMPYAGATTEYTIASGYNTNIFNGSIVTLAAGGTIELAGGTGADITTNNFGGASIGAIGVFVGCEYVNAQGQVIHSQYFPAGTTGTIKCKVVDDPNVVFQADLDEAAAQAMVGSNTFLAAAQDTNSGSTATGNSDRSLDGTTVTTVAGLRVVGLAADANANAVYVKFTPGAHLMTTTTGV